MVAHMFDQMVNFFFASHMFCILLWLEMLSHNIYVYLLFQFFMQSWSNGEDACYVDDGGYLEEGFRGGTLHPPSLAWRWP